MAEQKNLNSDIEIKRAAQLSITEIGVGSIGHGFKIPLTGQLLSLNQLGFLLNALNRDGLPRSSAFQISGIASVLKSFSPAGQRLGPMLSIAMQGFLFWLGTVLFGLNIFGQLIGALLLSLWAFIQPFITLFLIYGKDGADLIEYYVNRVSDDYQFIAISIGAAISIVVLMKIMIAISMVILSLKFGRMIKLIDESNIQKKLLKNMPTTSKNPFFGALRDITKPLFVMSFILMIIFVWQLQSELSQKIWMLLRPLGVAFIIFYVLRSPWVAKKMILLSNRSEKFKKIYEKSQKAFEIMSGKIQ
jgi:hypothetical protein